MAGPQPAEAQLFAGHGFNLPASPNPYPMSASTRNIIAWVLQVLLGLAFIASGVKKFTSLSTTVEMFSKIGLPGALAYVVASAEVLGGIGLLIPRFTRLAASGLVIVMIGAVVMHATKIPGGLAGGVPAIMLLVLLLVLIVLRRPAPLVA
jgi:putative oxidoreductase